ncbi:hypothetical protein DFA_04100 [Cavenderia fasciculata]|uniref:ABC3 transporter permease C-terminal domain-containing protein n=1 Tax=Cavenderia fasciculata TaxID=261658 RepID=F4Q1A5_CACFS|nr:uncharacterized protein DFA_04100 [Cavenderia fasciculata]EGG18606.1 hypothetical protein DFA_04100 [Cavenderia fasciculata]|eukprot:XP_004366510.1 hypothetical protein DFA_04100 [Cavenderia fasciculata]
MSTTKVFKSTSMNEVKLGRIGTVGDSRRYQKLTEVDPSIIDDGDSDEDDSVGYYKHAKGNEDYDFSSVKGTLTYCYHFLRYTLLGDFQVAFRYVHKNSKKNIKSLVLGLLTVFLVVLFISFLQNLIQASPIVFLKLSEDQTGELDLILTGDPSAIMGSSGNTSLLNAAPTFNNNNGKNSTGKKIGKMLKSYTSTAAMTPTDILSTLNSFDISSFFLSLDQVFNCVAAVLLVLGALMIYSLLLSDVEGKTFEYGMLRAQGLRHYALIILLITQAVYFSVPGIILGLFMGWVFFAIVAHFVYAFVILPVNLTYYPVSIVSGVFMGFFIPIIANIAPIQRALSRTLRDALDVYHQVKNETMVKIMKLEEVGIDLLQTLLAVLAVGVGFTVYYLIPYAFTFYNFSRPATDRACHLVCARVGTGPYVIVPIGPQELLTRLGVGSDIAILATSIKDPIPEAQITAFLNSDMANNSNSIIAGYTTVTFPLNKVLNIQSTHLRTLANYPDYTVRVYGMDKNFLDNSYLAFYDVTEKSSSLDFPSIPTSDLTTKKKNVPDVIESLYTNARKDLISLDGDSIVAPPAVQSYRVSMYNTSWVSGDSPLAVAYRSFNNSYIYRNYTDMVMSEAFRQACGADTQTPFNFYVRFKGKIDSLSQLNLLAKPQAMVEMFPSFLFSAYGAMATSSPVLLSNDQFQEIMQWVVSFSNDTTVQMPDTIPKSKLLIRLKEQDAPQLDREYIINGIKNFIKTDDIQVIDTQFLLGMTDTAVLLLDIFFYTVSGAAIALCFFMLWISFSANIHENSWEFGVLRAIGLTSFQVTRIYIYEALVLIFSSVILGLLIGLGIAITLTLQFDLFTQLPFSFQFPYALFFGVLSASILIAIGVSYQSSKEYRTRQIASVLKGNRQETERDRERQREKDRGKSFARQDQDNYHKKQTAKRHKTRNFYIYNNYQYLVVGFFVT